MKDQRIGWFLRFLVSLWKKDSPSPPRIFVDVVVATSWTTCEEKLTFATAEVLRRAIDVGRRNNRPILAMSHCSYPFSGAEDVEEQLRQAMIDEADRHAGHNIFSRVIHADPMVSTVNEALNIKKALDALGIDPSTIVVVTGEGHSCGAWKIYKKVFPKAKIYLSLFDFSFETQPDHPVHDQRSPWKWFIMNVLRQCALWVFPLHALAKVQHGNGSLLLQILRNLRRKPE